MTYISSLLLLDGQEGGGGPLAAFLRVFCFLFIHIIPVGWQHVRGVGAWVTGASRAQEECLRKRSLKEIAHAREYFGNT